MIQRPLVERDDGARQRLHERNAQDARRADRVDVLLELRAVIIENAFHVAAPAESSIARARSKTAAGKMRGTACWAQQRAREVIHVEAAAFADEAEREAAATRGKARADGVGLKIIGIGEVAVVA